MRAVLLVMVVAACDGGAKLPVDAGPVDSPPVMVDANTDIDGTWKDTYITANGSMTASSCVTAPSALAVDPTTAATTPYSGVCKNDGTFRIHAPGNLDTFYLRVGGTLYETTKHAGIDLSTDHLGRADVANVIDAQLSLNMQGLVSWVPGDMLIAFAPNVGYSQSMSFSSGGPMNNSTTLTGTMSWGNSKVDASKSDAIQLVQLVAHTTASSYAYLSLDAAYDVPAYTMANDTTQSVSGGFAPRTAGNLALDINVASFDQLRTASNPNITTRTLAGSAYAAPSSEVIPSPSLIAFNHDSSTVTAMDFGSLAYTDPFPSDWNRLVKLQEAFAVPYMWNSATGNMNALVGRIMTKSEAEASTIDARLGPPIAPKLDGKDAFTSGNISPVPVLSWDAPTLGTPTDYEVVVYEVQVTGSSLKFVPTLRLNTKQTSVRIPAGYLLGQRQYIFVIRARSRDNVDLYTTPLRMGTSMSWAETLSAIVTTDS